MNEVGTIAINIKTESCDEYIFLKEKVTAKEMVEYVEQQMGYEMGYVSDYNIAIIGNITVDEVISFLKPAISLCVHEGW